MKSAFALFTILLSVLIPLTAGEPALCISDLADDGRLLLTITADQPGWDSYTSLFSVNLDDNDRVETRTYFPEISRYFSETSELEIQNRFGLYRVSLKPSSETVEIHEMYFHPFFPEYKHPVNGKILPVSSSPDGKWVLQQEADGPVRGKLVLYSSSSGKRLVVSDSHVLSFRENPAMWSPDSRYFIYSEKGEIYYVSTLQIENGRLPGKQYREIGTGTLSNMMWTRPDALYYLRGTELLLLRPSEIFTKSFYSEPLPAGVVSGVLPIEFDPNFDSFWPSPDGLSVIILKGKRNLFYFPLNATREAVNLPFLHLSEENTVKQLWWRSEGDVFLLVGESLYHLDTEGENSFRNMNVPQLRRFVPSEDRRFMALLQDNGVSIRNPDTLKELRFLNHPDPRNLFWTDNAQVLIIGGRRIERVSTESNESDLLALSQVDKAGFDSQETLRAISGGRFYRWQAGSKRWMETADTSTQALRIPRYETPGNRVYMEENNIIVRTINGFGNRMLFGGTDSIKNALSVSPESVSLNNIDEQVFSHGSRTRGKTVSLVFNAIDGDLGLGDVLSILKDYNLKVTFFINGDFIRRHPESTRILAESGHETASLFYTYMNMTDLRYRIDKNFVVKGLGRNEDIFFQETGKELSTFWHAPWYVVSPSILEATQEMNYLYIGRDVDPLDWIVPDGSTGIRDMYMRSADLVERVLEDVRPGSIIPVRIGRPGERDDYLFQMLDLLINGLLNGGYDIVTVGELKIGFRD